MPILLTRLALGLSVTFALIRLAQPVGAQTVLKDEQSYLEFTVPSDWVATPATDIGTTETLRYKVLSPNKLQALYVYVFKSDIGFDLEKFVDLDSKLGFELGKRSSQYTIDASTRRRTYERGTKGLHATALFHTEAPLGYVMMAVSTQADLKFADDVFASVAVKVPWPTRLWNYLSSLLGWFGGVVLGLVALAAVNLLGRAGARIRRGVETRRALRRIQLEALEKRAVLNDRFQAAGRKATLDIYLPVFGFVAAFVAAFLLLPIRTASASLLGLAVPALGYFGILLGPSQDPSDYIGD